MDYLSAKEVAEKWNISRRRVQILCEEGRIEGAFKLSDVWVIPKDGLQGRGYAHHNGILSPTGKPIAQPERKAWHSVSLPAR